MSALKEVEDPNQNSENDHQSITSIYELNINELTDYIIQLQFGDQTQNVNATKMLRNFNFMISCNIWLFMYDENDDDNQWNMIIPLKNDQKEIASTELNTSHHQYKATKHKIANSAIIKTVSRIPNALKIGICSGIGQSADSAACIVVGAFLVIVSNVLLTRNQIEENIASPSPKKIVESAALIPLWACVSLVAGTLGLGVAIAAIPVQAIGNAGVYMCTGQDMDDVINWRCLSDLRPSIKDIINDIKFHPLIIDVPTFKQLHSLEERKSMALKIRRKYPDRIPTICEKEIGGYFDGVDNRIFRDIKRKYLVPSDLTFGQLIYIIRKRIKLPAEIALFGLIDDTLPSTAAVMSELYQRLKDEDGFLYVTYNGEHCYGH